MVVRRTREFQAWFNGIRDGLTVRRITARLQRLQERGHFGITRSVGNSVFEMKLDFGPGYRIYFTRRNEELILLLLGGEKSTQNSDIFTATQLARALDQTTLD